MLEFFVFAVSVLVFEIALAIAGAFIWRRRRAQRRK